MPFDALLAPARPRLLAEMLDEHGATPVPLEALAAHMQAQRERFAPSFWHQHQTWLPVGLIGSVVLHGDERRPRQRRAAGLVAAVLAQPVLAWRDDAAHRVRRVPGASPARAGRSVSWPPEVLVELGVPPRIALAGARPAARGARRDLVLGELVQQEVVLDPYLLLECDGERVCLGIWDGKRIIAAAASRE